MILLPFLNSPYIIVLFQAQLVQGTSHTRLNVSPLTEVTARMEADAAFSIKDPQIILSPAELIKPPITASRSNFKNQLHSFTVSGSISTRYLSHKAKCLTTDGGYT